MLSLETVAPHHPHTYCLSMTAGGHPQDTGKDRPGRLPPHREQLSHCLFTKTTASVWPVAGGAGVSWPNGRAHDPILSVHGCWAENMHELTRVKFTVTFQNPVLSPRGEPSLFHMQRPAQPYSWPQARKSRLSYLLRRCVRASCPGILREAESGGQSSGESLPSSSPEARPLSMLHTRGHTEACTTCVCPGTVHRRPQVE